MKKRVVFWIALIFSTLSFQSALAAEPMPVQTNPQTKETSAAIRATFINPANTSDFWTSAEDFMQAAADSLGIKLQVLAAENRYHPYTLAKQIAQFPDKPDYVFFIYQRNLGIKIFEEFEKAKINFITFNTDIIPEEKLRTGTPGENYSHWIGHSHPWTSDIGYELAKNLIAQIRSKTNQKNIALIALSGSHDSSASQELNSGLLRAIAEDKEAELLQMVYTQWKHSNARDQVAGLIQRYPKACGIWVLGNEATLGAVEGVELAGKRPGVDIFIAGTISSPAGISAIENGKLSANIGADLWEAAWNLIRIYDLHHGIKPLEPNATLRYKTDYVSKDTVAAYKQLISQAGYRKVDFKKFSRVLNPQAATWEMNVQNLLQAIPEKSGL